MIGKKYNKLTVIKVDDERSNEKRKYYLCQCECGNMKSVRSDCLKSGQVKSCGCLNYKSRGDGRTKEKLYHVWASMKNRCNNPNDPHFEDYGGRGIRVCEKWNGSHSYPEFKKWAYENGYKEGLSIDRIDVNGDYCPENCRWVSQKVQTRNLRCNISITYKNETHILSDWAEILNVNVNTLYSRIVKLDWDIDKAFETSTENSYQNGLNKANAKNKLLYEDKSDKVKSRVIELMNTYDYNDIIKIVKSEFNIKDLRTFYKLCCGSTLKRDFIKWFKNL